MTESHVARWTLAAACLLTGCAGTSLGVGVGGGGFGVGASVSPDSKNAISPQVYRRMEMAGEVCCPPDTILVPPFRGARGVASVFDTTYVSDDERMRACVYEVPEAEGGAALVLCVDDDLAMATLFVRPVAWEPGGSRLLMREAAADDDLKLFVLHVGDGQYTKSAEQRAATQIGRRGDAYRGWDGDTLLLENYAEPGAVRSVPIPVEGES